MTGIYDNATIDILSETSDEWGKVTEVMVYADLAVRIEPVNKSVRDKNGRELMADTLIIISTPDTFVGWDDKIRIKTQDDTEIETADKKYTIKSKFKTSGFVASHWEIYL